ncbi:MAG: NifB/NifX family molybdenum-iron cluster-binding protein [Clostridia bacterium]|nr:NifB/NifX family molybdenum-iron cluster-binding protein [Clostridia bacterium]
MRITVTFENDNVFQHFGHAKQIKLYDVQDGEILSSKVMSTMCSGHASMASLLKVVGTDILICGCIGDGAKAALTQAEIEIYSGVTGSADEAVAAFIEGKLSFNPDAKCDHH